MFCVALNPCEYNNAGCEQQCIRLISAVPGQLGYRCACQNGVLAPDNHTCVASGQSSSHLSRNIQQFTHAQTDFKTLSYHMHSRTSSATCSLDCVNALQCIGLAIFYCICICAALIQPVIGCHDPINYHHHHTVIPHYLARLYHNL